VCGGSLGLFLKAFFKPALVSVCSVHVSFGTVSVTGMSWNCAYTIVVLMKILHYGLIFGHNGYGIREEGTPLYLDIPHF